MDRVAVLISVAIAVLVSVGCQQSSTPIVREGAEEPAAPALPPRDALRVAPERLARIQLTQPGGQPVTLEKGPGGRWRVTEPLSYPANDAAVEAIVEVLAEIEVQRGVAARPRPGDRLGRDGVEVLYWDHDGTERRFRVGAATDDETLVQVGDAPAVYAVRGRCRRRFERTLTQLRDPIITEVDLAEVERVAYANRFGRLELMAETEDAADAARPDGHRRFVQSTGARPVIPAIHGFDSARASQNVAVLVALRAKGFVDASTSSTDGTDGTARAATGLFEDDTATATLWLRGRETPLTVWVGARTRDCRLHLRTSESEQVFLVSAHLASSLVPRAEHFARSDAMLRELEALAHAGDTSNDDSHGAAPTSAGPHAADHAHGSPPPTAATAEIMRELRDLARTQRR